MSTLSNKDKAALASRGIFVTTRLSESEIGLTPVGISWLLNYLHSSGKIGSSLNLKLLKDVAKFQAMKNAWRELRFMAVPIPVYSTNYFQLTFYLEGSPPRAFLAFSPSISSIPEIFDVPHMQEGVFKTRNDQIVQIIFSAIEVEQLSKGNRLAADVSGQQI